MGGLSPAGAGSYGGRSIGFSFGLASRIRHRNARLNTPLAQDKAEKPLAIRIKITKLNGAIIATQ